MARPTTLDRAISPPPRRGSAQTSSSDTRKGDAETERYQDDGPSLAAIEAGQESIRNHLEYFSERFAAVLRISSGPRISIDDFRRLYTRHQHGSGCHFVIHQHDHPIAGVHYDLRLQFSASSTVSFAVPYGMPGNPNSIRLNRMAIETRVHNLWNNLIESASHATGSLLIWDTGRYEVLSRDTQQQMTDDDSSDIEVSNEEEEMSQSKRLVQAFQSRHIRLRLHGVRLPRGYTVSMRLPASNARVKQAKVSKRKRRRLNPAVMAQRDIDTSSDSDFGPQLRSMGGEDQIQDNQKTRGNEVPQASDSADDEDVAIQANNAYPGSSNTIGSIHQRRWLLTLDRPSSGFAKAGSGPDAGQWMGPWVPFIVRGRDYERSVVTGRSADDIMCDEGVEKFVGRKMWMPIQE